MSLTIAEILNGPIEPISSHPVAPMTEAQARGYLRGIQANMPRNRRGKTIRSLHDFSQGRGKLSQEALALYDAYAKAYGA